MKKIISSVLLIALTVSLFACVNTDENDIQSYVTESSESSIIAEQSTSDESKIEEHSEASSEESSKEENTLEYSDIKYPAALARNIAEGKKYTSDGEMRNDMFGDYSSAKSREPLYKLTDGIISGTGDSDKIGGYGGNEATFTIDLGETAHVYGFTSDYYGNNWGVADPKNVAVTYSVSTDGESYFDLGTVSISSGNAEIYTANEWNACDFTLNLEKAVMARFVRIKFAVDGEHIWTSEIQVLGYNKAAINELESETVPTVYIKTENNDRLHLSSFHPCTFTIYDPSGKYTETNLEASIKIRGNSTSSGAKQPFNIKFENKVNLLGFGKCKKWYFIANMYDKTQIRNKLAYDFADAIGMDYVQQSTFVNVYINGDYRGCYQLCESIGVGATRVDIDTDENDMLLEYEPWENYANDVCFRTPLYNFCLGFNAPSAPTQEQLDYASDFFEKFENALRSKDMTELETLIDIDSFVDAYIVQELFKQVDYGTSSTRFYIKDGVLYEGPVWDFDLSSGNCSSEYYTGYNNVNGSGDSTEGWYTRSLWNGALFACPGFEEKVKARYKELQPYIENLYKDNELGECRIYSLVDEFGDCIAKNYTVWSTSTVYSVLERVPTDGTYDTEIEYLREWFEKRNKWILKEFGIK